MSNQDEQDNMPLTQTDDNADVVTGDDFDQFERELWALARAYEEYQHAPCGYPDEYSERVEEHEREDGVLDILWRCLLCEHEWMIFAPKVDDIGGDVAW